MSQIVPQGYQSTINNEREVSKTVNSGLKIKISPQFRLERQPLLSTVINERADIFNSVTDDRTER